MLKPVSHRSNGQLGDQPDQIRSEADVVRPLADCFLPASERGAQQGSRFDLAPLQDGAQAPRRVARAPGNEVVAEAQEIRQQAVDVEIDRKIEYGGALLFESFEHIGGRRARLTDDQGGFRQ